MTRRPGGTTVVALLATAALTVGCGPAASPGERPVSLSGVEAYDAALDPLRKRSDVLERRYAQVQGSGPDRVHRVLEEIVPEYADLLEESRALEVEDDRLRRAHDALLASLEAQQEGLELALRGVESGDAALLAEAAELMSRAQRKLDEHRRLLARAGS